MLTTSNALDSVHLKNTVCNCVLQIITLVFVPTFVNNIHTLKPKIRGNQSVYVSH